jgi:hypothetical protein
MALQHPVTPDGRYFIVKGGLWRLTDLDLAEGEKSALVSELMRRRRAAKTAKQQVDVEGALWLIATTSTLPSTRFATAVPSGGRTAIRISTGIW